MPPSSSPLKSALTVFLAPVQRNPAATRRSMSSTSATNNHNNSSSVKKASFSEVNSTNDTNNSSSFSPRTIANQYEVHNRSRNKNYNKTLQQLEGKENSKKVDEEQQLIIEDVDNNQPSTKNRNGNNINNNNISSTKKVRFDQNADNLDDENQQVNAADGGDVADSSSLTTSTNQNVTMVKYSSNSNTAIAPTSSSFLNDNHHSVMTIVYDPDPEIDSLVKRKLGQDNSNRIRLGRTLSQVEQDLALARKEHAKLSSRANSIPYFLDQLPTLREDCVKLRDDLENLEIEFGFFQQRYKDVDSKLDPLESNTSKNKKKLAAAVKESRVQQINATVVSLQKKEKMLMEEIDRLTEQRERAIAFERDAVNRKEKEEGVSAAMREQALRKALDEVRNQHQSKRNASVHQLQSSFSNEICQMAEEEVIRETREANKVGESTKKLGKAESENTAKKHEVTELTQRHAQQTARLQELTADLAVEQQRLLQSENALGPAEEELRTLNKLIQSAQEHLEEQAQESQVKKDQKQSSSNAASQAWKIEISDLERTVSALEVKVAGLREKESSLAQQVEKRKKQKEDLERSSKNEISNLMCQSQKLIDDGKSQSDQIGDEIQKYNVAAEKLEQDAAQIQQRLGASQKTEIIMQLQKQNGDLQGQIDSLHKGNSKLNERLKKILGQLGDDVML